MRRLISAFFYTLAGLVLVGMATMSFVADQPGSSRFWPIALMAPWGLVPLVVGALVSPGSRIREAGIVLLASAVLAGLGMAMILTVTYSPVLRAALPPESRKGLALFGDPWFGIVFVAAMAVIGLIMLLRGPYRPAA